MLENRISNFLPLEELTPAFAAMAPAFVACPLPLFLGFSSAHQLMVAEIYRHAQELTKVQLEKPSRKIPEFSRN